MDKKWTPKSNTDFTPEPVSDGIPFSNQIKKWLSILLPIFLGIFLTLYAYNQFSSQQIEEIESYFKNANYCYVFLAVGVAFIGNVSRAYRWKFSLEHMGYKSSFSNNFMAVSIGYVLNLTVPKSGEVSRALILKKYNNIPFDKGFGSIVAERIVDVLILLLFMILAVCLQFEIVKSFILDKIPILKLALLSSFGLVLLVLAILIYKYSKAKWILTLKHKISGLQEGLLSIVYMKKKMAVFLSYGLYLVFVSFDILPRHFCISANKHFIG